MNRRDLLEVIAATGLVAAVSARAAETEHTDHAHHDHAAMAGRYGELAAAAGRCVGTGDACIAHCLKLLADGDKEMAGCAKTVEDVIAACTALEQIAAANSPHTAKLAGAVGAICGDCETECRKHESLHSVCRDCAEACARCAEECRKAAAA